MFDKIRNSRWFVQVVLVIIIVPLALFGIDAYFNPRVPDTVATVGDQHISQTDFQTMLIEEQDQLRQRFGAVDQAVLNSPEFRRNVLEELIGLRLLLLHATESNLSVSDAALVEFIMSVPALQENGRFSRERYEALVAAQGMSVATFEDQVRQDLIVQQILLPVGQASLAGRLSVAHWMDSMMVGRRVAEVLLRADQFLADSQPDAAAIERFYQENSARFESPEQVRVEYVVLSQEALLKRTTVSDEEIETFYRTNEARFRHPEERQASHILIRADKAAPEAEVNAARQKAEQLLAQLKTTPGDFARLAREHSQDPGSAARGGDLGSFRRGMMVPPFEEAVFALQKGELSGVVRTDFGFHVIKLTEIRPAQPRPLAEVRSEILESLRRQKAAHRYAEMADSFVNTVYEQADSLDAVVAQYELEKRTSDWIVRGATAPVPPAPLNHPKLLEAMFTEDAIKHRRNVEAVDVGNNTLVAARVIEHRPAQLKPLAVVSESITRELAMRTATAKAEEAGKTRLASLQKGEPTDLQWGPVRTITRLEAQDLPPEALRSIFSASIKTLPTFAGAKVPGGYVLYRIDGSIPYVAPTEGQGAMRDQALRQHYEEVVAQEELQAWLASLRARHEVTIDESALERR